MTRKGRIPTPDEKVRTRHEARELRGHLSLPAVKTLLGWCRGFILRRTAHRGTRMFTRLELLDAGKYQSETGRRQDSVWYARDYVSRLR